MKIKTLLFVLALPYFTVAQTEKNDGWLIPFSAKTGKMGFVNEAGQLVIEPQFEGKIDPFFPKALSVDCRKNGETVRVFRNGLVVPNPRLMMHRTLPVLNFDEKEQRLDSISHLLAFQYDSKWQVLDTRAGGKMVETWQEDFLNLPKWAKMRSFSLTNGSDFRFRFGVMRVFRADGQVNFLDENLREILPKDVAAGTVADAAYLIFAEGEGRFGLADRSGKTVVAPVFRSLEPSGRTDFFIANKQRNGSIGAKWHCGLVRSDGKIVLDTVFSDIENVPGSDLFIVRNVGKTGLFDLEGRQIVHIEAEYIFGKDFGFSLVRWPNGGGMNLLDRWGKPVFEKNVAEVSWYPMGKKSFFKVKQGGWTSILDTALTVVARDSVENLDIVGDDPLYFQVRINGRQSRLVSIRDAAGKTIVDGKFESVWSPGGWPDGLRFIYLNNLKGIADRNFNEVLPPVFEEIMLEEGRRDTFIWAKKKGESLFAAFDKKGKKRDDIYLAPEPRRESAFQVIAKMQAISGGGNMATMFDGTQRKWPDSLKNQRVLASFRGQNGGAVVVGHHSKNMTTLLDHRFRSLLPPGFGVPENSAGETVLERFQQFGLLVVKKLPVETPVPKPSPQPKPKPTEPVEQVIEALDVKISDAPIEEYPGGFGMGSDPPRKFEPLPGAACGVIDWEGNWLLEPKTNAEYLPLSPFLVAEFPAGARSSSHTFFEKGLRLHRVQQDEKGFFEANWLGRDGFSREDGNTMKIGRLRAGTSRMAEYGYFDQKGKPITDWIFENGPDFLKAKNLVHIWEKDVLRARQAVIDANGKILFELGDLMTDHAPHRYASNWKLTFLTVKERKMGENLPEGLMDSTGRLVLPLHFFGLQTREDDRFLTAKMEDGKAILLNFEGQPIHVFENGSANLSTYKLGENTGFIAVWNDRETVILSPENQVVQRFALPFDKYSGDRAVLEKFVALLDGEQRVWADFRTGQVFAEK